MLKLFLNNLFDFFLLSFYLPYETLLNSKSQEKIKHGKIYKEDKICTIKSASEEE